MNDVSEALTALGSQLQQDGYHFCTPTPGTHVRVVGRRQSDPDILRRVFGWNELFRKEDLPPPYQEYANAPALFTQNEGGTTRAKIRFSVLQSLFLAHSAFPTVEADAVFFGPDTYRFAHALRAFRDRELSFQPKSCVDIGAGTGAGGLYCAKLFPSLERVDLADINQKALSFAMANARLNNVAIAQTCVSDVMAGIDGDSDLIVSNPPYLVDERHRAYRDGGGTWGTALSLRILEESLGRLTPRGHLLLYTGSPVVRGHDQFLAGAEPMLRERTVQYRYEEIDPDVFGEELDKWPYNQADRIATVMLHVKGSDLQR